MLENASGPSLFLGLHLFGTADARSLPAWVAQKLLCHVLIEQLPDETLSGAVAVLRGFAGATERIGSISLQDAEGALHDMTYVREQLARVLDSVDGKLSLLSDRIELGDMLTSDSDAVRTVTGAIGRRIPDDDPLACDPDEDFTD
jgi:hypothetical protein